MNDPSGPHPGPGREMAVRRVPDRAVLIACIAAAGLVPGVSGALATEAVMKVAPADGTCPVWCVFDHDRTVQPAIVLHESLSAIIEISGSHEADVPEWIDVRTTQYSPEESGEPPGPPAVELSCHQGNRYRVTTLTADEARQLAASLLTAAAHADGDPHSHDLHATKARGMNHRGRYGDQL
jgi:hypothetical protein